MTKDQLDAEGFYQQRDARTALEVENDVRLNSKLSISIDGEEADSFSGQLTFLELANLNARWCRTIRFDAPDRPVHPDLVKVFPGDSLLSAAIDCAKSADPFGDFGVGTGDAEAAVCLHVGSSHRPGAFKVVGRGWMAFFGDSTRSCPALKTDINPLGAVLSACIGASHALRLVMGHTDLPESGVLSLWNLDVDGDAKDGPAISKVNIGKTAIIGLGAIGGGIVHLLPLLQVQLQELALLDDDIVEASNLNRVPIFGFDDLEEPKVDVARNFLSRNGLAAEARKGWYSLENLDLGEFDLVIPAANEHNVQRLMMSNYPPLMIAGSTGADWTAYMQRHIPILEDCLECRIPTVESAEPAFVCSNGELLPTSKEAASGRQETGALPFLSLAAAVMAAAEIVKLASQENYPISPNCASICFRTFSYVIMASQRRPKPDCPYCWNPQVFKANRSSGRYSSLSEL